MLQMAPAKQDNAKRPPALPDEKRRPFLRYCFVLVLVGVALLAWASLLSFSPTDPPGNRADYVYPPKGSCDNAVGLAGAYLAHTLRYWLGAGAYMALLPVSGAAVKLLDSSMFLSLGWKPAVSLEEGLLKTYEWYQKQLCGCTRETQQ